MEVSLERAEVKGRERLTDALRRAISERLEANPHLSIQAIANRAGVSYNTISRILNGKGVPAMDQVLKILASFSDSRTVTEIIDSCPNSIREPLLRVYKVVYQSEHGFRMGPELEAHLQDEIAFVIYSLAANRAGTTRAQVERLFGLLGLEKLRILLEGGVVKVDSTGRIEASEKSFATTLETAKRHISNYAQYYRPGFPKNYLHTLSESVNENGLRRIIDLHREFHQKMLKVLNDPEAEGSIPVFSVAFTDSFLREVRDDRTGDRDN